MKSVKSMQSVNALLDQQFPANQSGPHKPTAITSQTLNAKQKLKLADAWQILLSRRLVTDPVGSDAHLVFERDMADLTEAQINIGLNKAKDFTGYFTLPAFRELCKASPQDLGLPTAKAAYVEACNKALPWERQQWSCAAVYHAARETGRFELHSFTEREAFPLFQANYEVMCSRVLNGEQLTVPVTRMLPESVPNPTTPEVAKSRLAAIKDLIP